jgi:hypothetical protein
MSLNQCMSQSDVLTLGHGLGTTGHDLKKILNQIISHPLVMCVKWSYVDNYVHPNIDTIMLRNMV